MAKPISLLVVVLLTWTLITTPLDAQWYFPPDPEPEAAVTSTTVTLPSFAVSNTIREINFGDAAGVGALPQGITTGLDPDGEEALLVVEVNGGQAHYYDLELNFVETIDIPEFTDGDQYLGVAYNSTSETYFWVKLLPSLLIESDADGSLIDFYEFETPTIGGQVADITYNDVTDSLWAYDFLNDEIFEIDPVDGTLTGDSFLSPTYVTEGFIYFGTLSASGRSISHMPGTDCFDITTGRGQQIDQVIHRMARIDVNGVTTGQTFDLPPGGTEFIGHTYHPTGSTDVPVVYIVDQTTGLIQEIEVSAECDPCAISGSVTDFECESNLVDSEVTLTWTVNDSPDSMELWSGGEFLREIDDPDAEVLVLDDLVAGFHDFTLSYTTDDDTCQTGNCATIVTGPGAEDGQLVRANDIGLELLDIAVIPEAAGSTDGIRLVCPGGLSGLTHIYDANLELIESVDSPQPSVDGLILHAGVVYNPDDEQLYFMVVEAITAEVFLLTTDLDDLSEVLDEFTLEDPDGPGVFNVFGGMDLNIDGDGFIVNDLFNDTYYIYDFEGALTDTDGFDSPFLEANGGVVTIGGNGVAKSLAKTPTSSTWRPPAQRSPTSSPGLMAKGTSWLRASGRSVPSKASSSTRGCKATSWSKIHRRILTGCIVIPSATPTCCFVSESTVVRASRCSRSHACGLSMTKSS